MKLSAYFPIACIIAGELMMFLGEPLYGLVIYTASLLIVTLMIILETELDIKNILQSYMLLILLKLTNLSMPQFFIEPMIQYSLIYGVMFIPIYMTIKNQKISREELGVNFRKIYIYVPAAILIGAVVAIIERYVWYHTEHVGNVNIVVVIISMFVFVGMTEEVMFRSILQTRFQKIVSTDHSIILSGLIFGIMYSAYGTNAILFESILGIVLGYIFNKTRSLPFVVLIRGSANVILLSVLSEYVLLPKYVFM